MAEEQHDGGVFIGSVNFDRGPSCPEHPKYLSKVLHNTQKRGIVHHFAEEAPHRWSGFLREVQPLTITRLPTGSNAARSLV